MKNWTAQPCEWEGTKIIEQGGNEHFPHEPTQVAAISMATPEALALMLAAPELLDALRTMLEAFEANQNDDLNDIPALDAIELMQRAIEAAEDSAPWEAANEFDKEGEA
jgi:hypothetical protein